MINIDVTVFYNGFHGDTSRTFVVPPRDPEAAKGKSVRPGWNACVGWRGMWSFEYRDAIG